MRAKKGVESSARGGGCLVGGMPSFVMWLLRCHRLALL
jgi:hypothetical protein